MPSKTSLLNSLIKLADQYDKAGLEDSADVVEDVMKKILAMEEESEEISVGIDDDEMDELRAVLESMKRSLE